MPIYKTDRVKNGKTGYRVVYCYTEDGKKKHIERTVYGQKEAKEMLSELEFQIKYAPHIEHGHDDNLTVKELCEKYTNAKKTEVRKSTTDFSVRLQRIHIIPFFEGYVLPELSKPLMQRWKQYIAEKNLSVIRNQAIYREMNQILNFAVKLDYIKDNNLTPLGNFRKQVTEVTEQKLRYYTQDEFEKFIAVAKADATTEIQHNMYVAFCFLYLTGCRKGEMQAVRWTDLDGNVLHIRRSISQKLKGTRITETLPKNQSSIRDIVLPKQLVALLAEQKCRQMQKPGFSEEWHIIGGNDVISDNSLFVYCNRCADEAGLHRISIHEFRHSHASLLINQGCNIQAVSKRLGHSSVEITTRVYSHIYKSEGEKLADELANIGI